MDTQKALGYLKTQDKIFQIRVNDAYLDTLREIQAILSLESVSDAVRYCIIMQHDALTKAK